MPTNKIFSSRPGRCSANVPAGQQRRYEIPAAVKACCGWANTSKHLA
ncbi:hypothetical protein KCP74_24020 [Salmonella enterica subsp. enterica]|nr:hypothetical protein KCP74_24020 [Salmonella enterica subsp. enterica]